MQAAHAALECGLYLASQPLQPDNIVVLNGSNESALRLNSEALTRHGIAHRLIIEPDMGDQATAIATEPLMGNRKDMPRSFFSDFTLWKPSSALMAQSLGIAPNAVPCGAIPTSERHFCACSLENRQPILTRSTMV